MRYFVVFPNGTQFGPADVSTINLWVAEGRVAPTTMLHPEMGGNGFPASSLPGLNWPLNGPQPSPPPNFAPGTTYAPPQPGLNVTTAPGGMPVVNSTYPRSSSDGGANDIRFAWICALAAPFLGLVLCTGAFLAAGGIAAAIRANSKGNPLAPVAIVANVVSLFVALFFRVFFHRLFHFHF